MKNTPDLKSIIKNDTGAFMCVYVPILFALVAVGSFIYFESGRDNYTVLEIIYYSPIIFTSLSVCLWPFILWWWYSINKTFKKGVELKANNTYKVIKRAFDLGVIYTFEYEGEKFEHVASFIPNSATKSIAEMQSLNIIFNPENNLSFIKDAYLEKAKNQA
ncbi:hypothetical protein MNBD_GAMMA08-1803 [hydrothermal vent metagenome]|uniref:Uncharacterized protein n=1 Tax=hydrothermal vent metagenome TaxID=652676 RepID=A0A3B0YDS1_9ZZZZ